jgi:hypothetical protein
VVEPRRRITITQRCWHTVAAGVCAACGSFRNCGKPAQLISNTSRAGATIGIVPYGAVRTLDPLGDFFLTKSPLAADFDGRKHAALGPEAYRARRNSQPFGDSGRGEKGLTRGQKLIHGDPTWNERVLDLEEIHRMRSRCKRSTASQRVGSTLLGSSVGDSPRRCQDRN